MIVLTTDGQAFFQVDMSVNLTTILGFVVWIITIAIAWTKFGARMDMIEYRVGEVEKAITKIAGVLEVFAKNDKDLALVKQEVSTLQTNFSLMNQTVEDLRRGRAWVQKDLDREYPSKVSG